MYYKYRKQIYTVLIIIVLIADFSIGKSMGTSGFKKTTTKSTASSSIVEKNINYGQAITITGTNYDSTITVNKAAIADNNTLKVYITESENNGVSGYKVLVFGNNNNILSADQTGFDQNSKTYEYTIKFDNSKDTKIKLDIYPLTNDMKNNANLKLDNAAFGETILDMNLVKQDTINSIQGTDGGSNGQ